MKEPADIALEKKTMESGLRVIAAPMQGTNTVTVMAFAGTGSRYEREDNRGVSHFLEHLFFKGSEKCPTYLHIAEALDRIGGEFNAFTSKDATAFFAKSDAAHASETADVIGDMMTAPLFDPAEVEREKGVIVEEMNMYEDLPMDLAEEHFEEIAFGAHPLGERIIGTREIIRGMERKAITDYVASQYVAPNMVVAIAGNIGSGEAFRLAEEKFGRIPAGSPMRAEPFSAYGKAKAKAQDKKTDQAHLVIGGTGVSLTDPDRRAASLLAGILGGGMSARLFVEVREKRGLAYYVRASSQNYADTGAISAQAGVEAGKWAEAVKVIREEFAKIAAEAPGDDEVAKVKAQLKGRMLLKLEATDAVASLFGIQEILTGRTANIREIFAEIDAVAAEDIRRVAETHFAAASLKGSIVAAGVSDDNMVSALTA